MDPKHLDAAALVQVLAKDRTATENEQLFHLLAVCPGCRKAGGWLLDLHRSKALPPVFTLADAALARSRAEAPALAKLLLSIAPDDRFRRLHADRRFLSWGLCEGLIRRSRQMAPKQASGALHLADLAVHIADGIAEGEVFGRSWVYSLRSLAWAALGNAHRVRGALPDAERSFQMADSWWEAGVGEGQDALDYKPILFDLKASLRLAQRRWPEAFQLLDDAVELFLNGKHQDSHRAGRSLIKKAGAHIEHNETDLAIQALKKANGLIDPAREPRLVLCVRHNLADNLSKAGRSREAAALLPDVKMLADAHGTARDRIRLTWVTGRVAAGLNEHELARTLLTRVRQTFLDEGNAFDAALAAVDLAISHLQEGQTAEVRALAEEMLEVFQGLEVSREPMAAVLLFHEAAVQEIATAELAREIAAALGRARGGGNS